MNSGKCYSHTPALSPQKQQFFAKDGEDPLYTAFDKRSVIHPGLKGCTIDSRNIQQLWSLSMATEDKKVKRAAYFHIPFCETHCIYCIQYLNPLHAGEEENRYVDYVIRELRMVTDTPFINSHPFHAIYLGGGTPTALSAHNLRRLLKSIRKYLPLSNDCEVTVEGRIYNFTDEKISACLEGGANRFSIGVQSFNTFVRHKMGRKESKEKLIKRLQYINNLDQAPVLVDLIMGLPYQTVEIWENDIMQGIDLGLEGFDLYRLIIFQRIKKAADKAIMPPPADISTQADMFRRAAEIMKNTEYYRFFSYHWAKTKRERNIYNILSMSGRVIVPFGSGAMGRLKGYTFLQDLNLQGYYRSIDEKNKPICHAIKENKYSQLLGNLWEKMETNHCNLKEFTRRYQIDFEELFSPLLTQWEKVGLVKMEEGWIKLTLAGDFWVVNLCQNLIEYFNLVITRQPAVAAYPYQPCGPYV